MRRKRKRKNDIFFESHYPNTSRVPNQTLWQYWCRRICVCVCACAHECRFLVAFHHWQCSIAPLFSVRLRVHEILIPLVPRCTICTFASMLFESVAFISLSVSHLWNTNFRYDLGLQFTISVPTQNLLLRQFLFFPLRHNRAVVFVFYVIVVGTFPIHTYTTFCLMLEHPLFETVCPLANLISVHLFK